MAKLNNKNGSILVLSLLVLSGILIIGIAVGTIVLNQLKQAKNLDYAIIAYYAADSANENALYRLRKLDDSPQNLNDNFSSGTFTSNSAEWEREIASTTPYSALLRKNQPVVINLYDSDADCGLVKRVRYIWSDLTPQTNHPNIEVTYYAWEVASGDINIMPGDGEQEQHRPNQENQVDPFADPSNYPGPWNATNTLITLKDNTCYTIRVKALYDDAEITVKTYKDVDATDHIGIPSFLTVNSLGKYKTAKQRIETMVLKDPPLSNIFEYVLFSEEEIKK